MDILSNEKINFNSLEEKIYKDMMKLGRETIQEQLRLLDRLIKDYRDKDVFKCKDMQPTTIKSKLGEIPLARRRYIMEINGIKTYSKLNLVLIKKIQIKLYISALNY